MQRRAVRFTSQEETLAGELLLPAGAGPHPAILLIGGTFSDTRDGDPALSLIGQMPAHSAAWAQAPAAAVSSTATS
jgi:hypothetical protein